MKSGGIDKKETLRLKRADRKMSKLLQSKKVKNNITLADFHEINEESSNSSTEEEYIPPSHLSKPKSECKQTCQKMTLSLPSLAKASDRTGVSDRSAAVIATSVLHDVGIVSPTNTTDVIDQNKVRRERSKTCENLQQNDACFEIEGLFFDGRKDKTLKQVLGEDQKFHRKTLFEEHHHCS